MREGVIIFLEDSHGRLAMQLRTGASYGGTWGLFGGWIEEGETPDEAVHREMMEELCLTLQPDRLTYLRPFEVPSIDAVAHLYHYRITDQELAAAVLGEGQAFRTMPQAEIEQQEMASFYRDYLGWFWTRATDKAIR